MKRFLSLSLTLIISIATFAQLNGNGYYRVKNNGTGTYIWVCDNTGKIIIATTSADMGAVQLWKGLDKAIPEPESVLYFENKGGNTWNISAMGTSIYDIIGHNIELSSATQNGVTLYEVSATYQGQTLYLFDGLSSGAPFNGLKTSGAIANRKWLIEPIITNSDNYFGIKPTITIGNKYYEPFYASFPFSFASSGMKAYYINLIDGNIAVLKEIKDDVIPAKTPIIIECSSANPTNNRLNLLTSGGTPITDNKLTGNFFANEFRPDSRDASKLYDDKTMRVWNKSSNGKLTLNTDKSLLHESWFGDGNIYLNATSSYLSVANGTAAELTIMTEEEYNDLFGATPGDVNEDGKVTLVDATSVINHVLNKTPSNFNEQAADINGDGKITLVDATMIINKILNK